MKPLVGVVHLHPLPSALRGGEPFESVLEAALRDGAALAEGGADGILVENFGDAPFHKGTRDDPVPPDVPAALAVVARELGQRTGLPIGINCLRNDACAALGAAAIAGARWVRVNVLSGASVTDQGLIEGDAARVLAYRKRLGSSALLLADLLVKHAAPLALTDVATAARDLAERSGADAVVVSGSRTGEPPDRARLQVVREAIGAVPLWIGSGLNVDNASELWPICDGAIVGTALKEDGCVDRPIDAARVAWLRATLDELS